MFLVSPWEAGVETNPLQMAQAYAAFANEGLMPELILLVELKMLVVRSFASHKIHKTG